MLLLLLLLNLNLNEELSELGMKRELLVLKC